MRKILLSLSLCIAAQCSFAQITITSSDMPVINDTLRWSSVLALGSGFNIHDSGANHVWDYSNLVPNAQGLDQYKSALSVNVSWGLIDPAAYGYKVADSLPTGGAIPITVQNIYNFFKKNGTTSYNAVGFGATISGSPIPAAYSAPDTVYYFPLAYGNIADTSVYAVNTTIPLLGTWVQTGIRYTVVDGWGTIKTPYYTSPVNCIRVRSEKVETDSVNAFSQVIKFPVHTVDYKFLVNGQHYPALWVTTTVIDDTSAQTDSENVTAIRFRDVYRDSLHPNSVSNIASSISVLNAYPNPAADGKVYLDIPASWVSFSVDVYDMQGKLVNTSSNKRELNLQSLSKGNYIGRVSSGDNTGLVRIAK